MTATFTVYETDGTSRGNLPVAAGSWSHVAAADGIGRITVSGTTTSSQLGETQVIRVNDGTQDVFGFVPLTKTRRQVEGDTEIDLVGPGVRWFLHAGQVLQEDTSTCARTADVRWFGWMSGDYVDTAWTAPASHGTFRSQPFDTVRPKGWPDPFAEYIWRTTSFDLQEEEVLFRQEFTLADEQDLVLCIAADDEYDCWLDGTKLPIGNYGDEVRFEWEGFDKLPMRLCAGTHIFAVRGRNLAGITGANPAWVLWTFAETAGDGEPAAANEILHMSNDAESGTFTVRMPVTGYDTTVTVDYDESPTDYQTKLEAVFGAGNVDVSGQGTASKNDTYELYTDATGGTFTLTVDGQTTSNIAYNASPATIEAALEALSTVQSVTCNTGSGTSGSPWVFAFDGADAETSFSVSKNGSGLTGGGASATLTRISLGTPYDPWIIEFLGDLANTPFPRFAVDDSGLVGGTITHSTEQQGGGADSVAASGTLDVVHWNPQASGQPGMTPTHILRVAMEEAQARGVTVLDDLTDDFTDTTDSAGATPGQINLPLPLPASIHRLSVLIEESGFDVDVSPALVLRCWAERGSDLSGTVTFTAGAAGATGFTAGVDEQTVRNVIRLRTSQGWADVIATTSVTARGRWESGLTLEGYESPEAAAPATDLLLGDLATPPKITTFDVPSEAAVVPYDDFGLGDLVSAPAWGTSGFTATDMRIVGLSGRVEESSVVWTVQAVD